MDGFVLREFSFLEILFKEYVVVFRRRFHERELHFVHRRAHIVRNRNFFRPEVGKAIRLFGQCVDHAHHLVPFHDRKLNGSDGAVILFAERRNRTRIIGVFFIHAVDEDDRRLFQVRTLRNRLFRADRNVAVRTRYNERGTARTERLMNFTFKIVKTGNVDQVEFGFFPNSM